MNWLRLPPLASLRAFSAFAETGNVVQAGAALNVSHAAISQQLRALEKHLGANLLDRRGRALSLTPQGRRLAQALELGFGAIATAVEEVGRQGETRPVHVSLTSSFAAFWLMPRLPAFQKDHPEIDLVLDPTPDLVAFRPGGVDLAIRFGQGEWPGVQAQLLFESPLVVVAAPSLMAGRDTLTPQEIAELPWLEQLGTTEMSNWLSAHGLVHKTGATNIHLPGNLTLDAARAGQGVTVAVRHFVERDLDAGLLVELFQERQATGYYIVTGASGLRPAAKTFLGWLLKEARRG